MTYTPFSAHPPQLLADSNINEHIVRGLRRKQPSLYIVTAHSVGLDGVADPDVLAYAAQHDLILITHDIRTMPAHFATFLQQLKENEYSPGVWYLPQTFSVGAAIEAIIETWLCSDHSGHRNRELRLP